MRCRRKTACYAEDVRARPRVFKTPDTSTSIAAFVVGIPAGIWDIDTFAERTRSLPGTLFAAASWFSGGSADRAAKETTGSAKKPSKSRLFPLVPILSIACCLLLMMGLPLLTWIRFFLWLIIGLVVYAMFGKRHSAMETA